MHTLKARLLRLMLADGTCLLRFRRGYQRRLVPAIATDDATIDTPVAGGATTTGITAFALDAFHVFRIDCTTLADIKFYVDGVSVLGSTTFSLATNANVMVQPFLMCHKETSAGDGELYIDYVRVGNQPDRRRYGCDKIKMAQQSVGFL